MSKEFNTPAFPVPGPRHDAKFNGMTLRDYFAAKALPAAWKAFENGYFDCDEESINASVASCAYQMADAMLAARDARAKGEKP